MRSIPIQLSAEIVGTKRQKVKNGLPPLTPILEASQASKEIIEVTNEAAKNLLLYVETQSS